MRDSPRRAAAAAVALAALQPALALLPTSPPDIVGSRHLVAGSAQCAGPGRQPCQQLLPQAFNWSVASYPVTGPLQDSLAVNETVGFSQPVSFDTSFEMVVLGLSIAGSRSSTGAAHSLSDFGQTIRWLSVQGVTLDGQAMDGYTLSSAGGIDWSQAAAVPEPASALLLGTGALLLARRRGR